MESDDGGPMTPKYCVPSTSGLRAIGKISGTLFHGSTAAEKRPERENQSFVAVG
jgi:hypothetical protein